MSTAPTSRRNGATPFAHASSTLRTFLLVSGVVMLAVGLVIFIWPDKSAVALTWIVAAYTLVAGLVYAALGLTAKLSLWPRIGHILLGLLFIAAAVVAFLNPAVSTVSLAIVVTVFIGVSWIFDGVIALTTLSLAPSKGWTVLYAILSILGGAVLIFSPLIGGLTLWLFFGATLIVLGISQIVRAFALRKLA